MKNFDFHRIFVVFQDVKRTTKSSSFSNGSNRRFSSSKSKTTTNLMWNFFSFSVFIRWCTRRFIRFLILLPIVSKRFSRRCTTKIFLSEICFFSSIRNVFVTFFFVRSTNNRSESQSSLYMKELQEFILRIQKDYFNEFQCKDFMYEK